MDISKIGTILLQSKIFRDAIHVAVMSVVAGERIKPGQKIGWLSDGEYKYRVGKSANPFGVADPFLSRDVMIGETFLCFINPNDISAFKHDWQHISIPYDDNIIDDTNQDDWCRSACNE